MRNTQSPIVTLDGLSDPTLPAVMSIPRNRAEMPKSGWLDWLECHTRFKFESPFGKFTAYKSKKGYWAAQRRVSSKLRHEYLGGCNDVTLGKVYVLDGFQGKLLSVRDLERLGYKVVNRREPMNLYTLSTKSKEAAK